MKKPQIGDEISLNGQSYLIKRMDGRSYILEKDGKEYRATEAKIEKILIQNAAKKISETMEYPNLERRLGFKRIFNKSLKIPTNEEECLSWFRTLFGELSPENLSCDGESSRSQILAKEREIKACWRELESICGRKFSREDFDC